MKNKSNNSFMPGIFFIILMISTNPISSQYDSLFQQYTETNDTNLLQEIIDKIQLDLYGDPTKLLENVSQLEEITKKENNLNLRGRVLNCYGLAYYVNEQFDAAIDPLTEAIDIFESTGNKKQLARANNSLATVNVVQDPKNAIIYFNEALKIYEELNDSTWIANINGNLGTVKVNEKKYLEAIPYLEKAITISSQMNQTMMIAINNCNLGIAKVRGGFPEESIEHSKVAIELMPYQSSPMTHAASHMALGEAYLQLNQLNKAKTNLDRSYHIAIEMNNQNQRREMVKFLSDYYEKIGDYKNAFKYEQEWGMLRDSILSEEQYEKMANAIKKYEGEKKQQQIVLLSAENEIKDLRLKQGNRNLILSLLGLFGLGIFSFVIYKSHKKVNQLNSLLVDQKAVITKSLKEKEVLLKEIHHRVKNNLQVVSSLLTLQSKYVSDGTALDAINTGKSRVQSMSILHRNLYQNENLKNIRIKPYFDDLIENLVNTYKLGDKEISIQSDVDDIELDVDTVIPMGLITNELISNALKYAFEGKENGQIALKIKNTAQGMVLSVADDGVGIPFTEMPRRSKTLGMQLIHSFSKKLKAEISINNEKGTSITLTIPSTQLDERLNKTG